MKYRRNMGSWGLMFSAISAMIGSGWLFSALVMSRTAGPISTIAWLIGGLLIIVVAFTYAELSTMLPVTGGSVRFPQLTHGTFVSLSFAWITWINLMTAPPIETQAVIQYSANYWSALVKPGTNALTPEGYAVATVLMIIFGFLNAYSIRLVNKFNSILTIWKIFVPILTAIVLIWYVVHTGHMTHNFTNPKTGGFNPYGWNAVFVAISTGGVLFAFNGYKQVVELAGETANPKKNVIRALLGSLGIVMIIYFVLQIGFVAAIPHAALLHGWAHLSYVGDHGPNAGLLMLLGFTFFAIILYSDSLVATGAAGIVYSTSAGRTLYAMSANGQLPKFLSSINSRGIPFYAVLVNFILGMTFFMPFKGWHAMIAFMSAVIAVSYLSGPVCCFAARFQLPKAERKLKLPLVFIWCFLAFFICSLLVFWGGWHNVKLLGFVLVVSLILFSVYRLFSKRSRGMPCNLKASVWLWVFFIGISLISYLSQYGGGIGVIPVWLSYTLVAVLSMLCLTLAAVFKLSKEQSQNIYNLLAQEVKSGKPADLSAASKV